VNHAVKIRLTHELSAWLAETARQTGSSEERVVIRTLEKARAIDGWLRQAGKIRDLAICPRGADSKRGEIRGLSVSTEPHPTV